MDLTKPIEEMTTRELRALGRIQNITAAIERLVARIERSPDHPRVPGWQARLVEYQQSLVNLRDHGVEVVGEGSGVKGVEINVPVYDFQVKANPPAEG